MFLTLSVKQAILQCTAPGENGSFELILDCTPVYGSSVLEIGDNHIFAHEQDIRASNNRKKCGLKVYLRRWNCLSPERIEKIGLNDEKIGELGFYPDCEPRDFAPSRPASLEAAVFVSDLLFERVTTAFQAGRKAELIYLGFEKADVIGYGWEPDGSQIEWKIHEPKKPSYIDVSRFEIRLAMFLIIQVVHFHF